MAQEVKHTPGPWKATRGTDDAEIEITAPDPEDKSGDEPWNIATVYGYCGYGEDQSPHNARLIAAAPELLEALKAAKETIRVWHGPNAWDIYDRCSPEMKVINAAIAKAEGRSDAVRKEN